MTFFHAHTERHLHAECGHIDTLPAITNCTEPECTRPKLAIIIICSWCSKCCACLKLWQLLGTKGSEESIWIYWNSIAANQDEPGLRILWGPSKLVEIDAAKLSPVATRTDEGAQCWLRVLMRTTTFTLRGQANSVIRWDRSNGQLHQCGNIDDSTIEDILKASIVAMLEQVADMSRRRLR